MQPGWYPDPFSPAGLRWWDGTAWTAHTAPAAAPAPTQYGIEVGDPVRDLASEHRWARRASLFIMLSAAVTVVSYLLFALVLGHQLHLFFHQLSLNVDQANADGTVATLPPMPGDVAAFDVLSLVALVPTVFLIIWLNQAVTVSSRLGIPARRSQVWAILGFLVPVVNLWFPFQVAQDTMPFGDPGRRIVAHWWGWFLVQGFVGIPVLIIAIFSTPIALPAAVVASIAPVMAARWGRLMIARVAATHRQLLGAAV